MPLQQQSLAGHNCMLGQQIPHPKSTKFHDGHEPLSPERTAKRRKVEGTPRKLTNGPVASPRKSARRFIADSEDDDEIRVKDEVPQSSPTDLETALPPIATDAEAIEEYEAGRAAQEVEDEESGKSRLDKRNWTRGKSSIYVDAFNLALDTVLEEEAHLFDEAERALFATWRETTYAAQYLYVRLFLRKTSAWHRVNSLGYHSDIGNMDTAIAELQHEHNLPDAQAEVSVTPGELEPPVGTTLGSSFTFADRSDTHIHTLDEASSLLKLDELKVLAKDAKVQGKNKRELLRNFRRASRQQTGLLGKLKRSDTEGSAKSAVSEDNEPSRETTPFSVVDDETIDQNRDSHFLRKIMDETGPCIRLTLAPLKLFERVHLVFYRSTEWTEKSLTAIILARIARRNFPEYIVCRSASVFESRALLVEFEAALRTQFRIDNILEFSGRPTAEGLQHILDVGDEVYPRWQHLVQKEELKEQTVYQSGEGAYLRRLSPAWVYTRIIHKAAFVLGKLKEHKREHALLAELLRQRLFHHARRGDWYSRKALLEEHYMHALTPRPDIKSEDAQKKYWKRVAMETSETGLQDPLVHIIYHHDLQKRVRKLEKALNTPKRLQHDFSHVKLAKPVEVYIGGIQIQRSTPVLHRRNSSPHPGKTLSGVTATGALPTTSLQSNLGNRGSKTIWLDPEEGFGECIVEAMCLSHYRSQGWKGYHCEGGIIRTLFAYLFYDVLFTYIPNVFQSPFQTCPLDLHTDAFYPSRQSEINARLNEISNGKGAELLGAVHASHFGNKTCIIGLDWSYELSDLLEIVSIFEGEALSTICKVMAQEYGQRGGGVPDLFLWHTEENKIKFVEVKSENDRLSDTQRLWIHVLTGAGIVVELANARAKEVRVL